MTRREGILQAVAEASKLLGEVPVGARTSFDIVRAVVSRRIPLFFRPLDGLLGANIRSDDGAAGILVTTRRNLAIQRFTLAHELGHILLDHQPHLDTMTTVDVQGPYSTPDADLHEVAANTFASELLGARDLVLRSARRHGWTRKALRQRRNVYQLALRLGLSYKATCWALRTASVLTHEEARCLQKLPVKQIKQSFDPLRLQTNARTDVWLLTSADRDTCLEAGPEDLFAVELSDHVAAGYLWRLKGTGGAAKVVGEAPPSLSLDYGGRSTRTVYLRFDAPGMHELSFELARPWTGATLDQLTVNIHALGSEQEGLPRRQKREALASAA